MLTNNFIHAVPSINVPIELIKYISCLEYIIFKSHSIFNRSMSNIIQIVIATEE